MAEKIYLKNINLGGIVYGLGLTSEDLYAELGITKERFVELLSRDFYCPTLSEAPLVSTLTYVDADGSTNHFQVGQPCRWKDADGVWQMAIAKDVTATSVTWYTLPTRTSQLQNDSDFSTNASVDSKVSAAKSELDNKINTVNTNLTNSINSTKTSLTNSINSVNSNLSATINSVKTSLEASMAQHKLEVDAEHKSHKKTVDTELNEMQVEFETLITEHRDYMYGKLDEFGQAVEETLSVADEAGRVSYEAHAAATQASTDAAAAVAAVATLEGLANTTTAQQTLAAQVAQIEANKQNILVVPNFELVKSTTYDL